jgi:hypothetical protein
LFPTILCCCIYSRHRTAVKKGMAVDVFGG